MNSKQEKVKGCAHLKEEVGERLEHLPGGEDVAQERGMVRVGLQQRRRIVRVILQHNPVVRVVEGLLVLHEPGVEVLALPEFDFERLTRVHVVAEGGQALRMRGPREVEVGGERAVEKGEVDEEAALRQQRNQKACPACEPFNFKLEIFSQPVFSMLLHHLRACTRLPGQCNHNGMHLPLCVHEVELSNGASCQEDRQGWQVFRNFAAIKLALVLHISLTLAAQN